MNQKPPDKMSLVYLKRTRQVMAAATRGAVPAGAVPTGSETDEQKATNTTNELKSLVGDEIVVRDLPVHSSPATNPPSVPVLITSGFSLPAEDLDVITIEFKPLLFKDARNYVIDKDNQPQQSLDSARIDVLADATGVTVTLRDKPTADTAVTVWVYRDDKTNPPVPLDGFIKPSDPPPKDTSCRLAARLSTDVRYFFLTFVQGYRPAVYEQTL